MSNYSVWWLVQPSHLMLFALALGTVFIGKKLGRRLVVISVLAYLTVSFTPLAEWLARPLEQRFQQPAQLQSVDGIIVLAGAAQPTMYSHRGVPHFNGFADRLTNFIRLARQHPNATLVHAGRGTGPRGSAFTQSSTAAELFIDARIDNQRLTLENLSINTHQAAENVARMGKLEAGQRWVLVTSAFHMPRAVASFRAEGLDVIPFPVDYLTLPRESRGLTATQRLEILDLAAHEWVGLLYYRHKGYIQ